MSGSISLGAGRQWRTDVLRDHNAQLILETLLDHRAGLTQQAIREQTALAPSTISTLVTRLGEARVVAADKPTGGGRNREPQRWRVLRDATYAVGVSIGRQRISVSMVNAFGDAISEDERLFDALADRDGTLSMAVRLLKNVVGSRDRCEKIAALTVSLPGLVIDDVLDHPHATSWKGKNIREELGRLWAKERLALPRVVQIERDADAAARGELVARAGTRWSGTSLLYVHWSASVTAGLILNRETWRGARNRAGDFGHVKVLVSDAERSAMGLSGRWTTCAQCGQIDCVDVRANTRALADAAQASSAAELLDWATGGPSRRSGPALDALEAGAVLIGRGLGPMLTMLDVDAVVVGGLVGRRAFELVRPALQAGVDEAASAQRAVRTPIQPTALGPEATALGAALWGLDSAGTGFMARKLASR